MSWPEPITLNGEYVTLTPLSQEHHDGLVEAVKDGELWRLWYTSVPKPENMRQEIDRRLNEQSLGHMLPFTISETSTGKILGMTTYMNIDATNKRLEIGYTWYRKSAQRTSANTEAKLLLLIHAFEKLDCIAVEFRTSSFNFKSQQAILRLGAKFDGVLRSTRIQEDGSIRDSCVYSIIKGEWLAARSNLNYKLNRL